MRKTQQRQRKKPQKKGGTTYNISLSDPHHTLPTLSVTAMKNKVLFLLPCLPPPSTPMQSSRARSCQSDITSIWHKTTTTAAAARKKHRSAFFFVFYCRWPCGKWQWGLGFFCPTVLEKERDNCPLERDSQFWPPLYIFFAFLYLLNWRS